MMTKQVLFIWTLLLCSTVFAQELTPAQNQELKETIAQMTVVMEMNEEQIEKMTEVKAKQIVSAVRLANTTNANSKEGRNLWKAYDKLFYCMQKEVVLGDQWKKWKAFYKA